MNRPPTPAPLPFAAALAVFALLRMPASMAAAEAAPAISPDLRSAIDAVVAALAGPDPAQFERVAQERFTPELLGRRTAEERQRLHARLRGDFGAFSTAGVRAAGPWAADVDIRPAAGELRGIIHLELAAEPPHRIEELGIRVEAGGGGEHGDDQQPALPPLPSLEAAKDGQQLAALLDPYLARLAEDSFSGVVLIARDGKPLYQRAYGLADRERKIPNTLDTRFNVASIGKTFTQTAIGQLLQQGKLALDDLVGKHLPAHPNATAAGKATLQDLLKHRAGVPDIFRVVKEGDPPPTSNHDWYQRVAPQPLDFEPGAQMRYCNGCYVVLGEIVAAVSGERYEDYLARHVFAPAGMAGAAFLAADDQVPLKAIGYTRTAAGLQPASLGPGGRGSGAGGVYATAADLLAYDSAVRTRRLLDAERTAWLLGGDGGGEGRATGALGAAGGAPGTNAVLESDGTWTVIVLTNRDPRTGEDLGTALAAALRR